MKIGLKMMIVAAVALAATSCRDRAAEKKIAELESRLAQLEGNKSPAAAATPSTNTPTTAPEEKPKGPLPIIQFETTDHDFGTVIEGQKVSYTYSVKNVGEAP